MDGEVEIRLRKLGAGDIGPTAERGSNALAGRAERGRRWATSSRAAGT